MIKVRLTNLELLTDHQRAQSSQEELGCRNCLKHKPVYSVYSDDHPLIAMAQNFNSSRCVTASSDSPGLGDLKTTLEMSLVEVMAAKDNRHDAAY